MIRNVTVALGDHAVLIPVETTQDPREIEADKEMGDDDSSLRDAAVAWAALKNDATYTVNGTTYTASDCAEWWA